MSKDKEKDKRQFKEKVGEKAFAPKNEWNVSIFLFIINLCHYCVNTLEKPVVWMRLGYPFKTCGGVKGGDDSWQNQHGSSQYDRFLQYLSLTLARF